LVDLGSSDGHWRLSAGRSRMRFQAATTESVSFATRGLPPGERNDALRKLQQRGVITVDALADHIPRAAIRKRFLSGADILSGTLSGLRQFGTQHGGDNVFLSMNLVGESTAWQRGNEVTLHSGDALLFSSANGGCTINRPRPVHFAAMRIPYRALAPLVTNLDEGAMRLIPRETSSLRLLATYLRAIDMGHALDSPDLFSTVASHIHDLVALSLGAPRDYQRVAQERSVGAARLQTMKADIAANLGDCELSVNSVAARHGVTPRYVQKLFASEGATFSEFVLNRRLTTAYRLLSDPRLAYRTISSIAFDLGFSDLSYFNRTFRRRHEATPTEVRARAIHSRAS
jgi:AraC-like DNA-binding protein